MKEIIIVHDFDGRPYFKALEKNFHCKFINSRPIRFLLRDLIKKKKITKDSIDSLLFLFLLPFHKNQTIILGMAPFNFRLLIYGILCYRNKLLLHSSWHQWLGKTPFSYPKIINKILKKAWRHYLPRFSRIIAVTRATKRSILDFAYPMQLNIDVIPHVVDIEPIARTELDQKWDSKDIQGLFVGRLTPEKGIKDIIDIAEKMQSGVLQNSNIKIAGKGNLENDVVTASKNISGLSYIGYITSREELKDHMRRSNFFLLPSKKIKGWEELFGLVIVEAMSQGCVVIASKHIGPQEIIEDHEDGILCEENEFITQTLRNFNEFHADISRYKEISLHALDKSQKYNMKYISHLWSELINNLER
ncbi:glycosyltransferase family 4 protein [Enterobacter hormaechei subsp. steigerwaltii]|uniref:glycosyltransferase family 4 protein n=1 Tax=Enterobacter roggenkampii TaxID=1812935 RepID=UPI0021CA0210|nr:glycosyltransferase family 4 protein [Enterobacter roggenkampii]MCU2294635.1 glycosyltransferase family 4 protein [Enterobacter hormaechei subsp. steigerwaltii]MCU2299444.1 glycosyltransferase family 4 protein [Enterobacter hormaechei subsp. steigerwaltii]MCU2324784.1 glycosyltransferase family 4 protein [Enterobacter hormaechei subsp. steigerwaltii]MCU2338631.1 glycosyltransferase family 4 protein [Enterobacter hormaechei subsp. steigerwaltii]MCU2344131.1 glycosyltransferase family 4 prote